MSTTQITELVGDIGNHPEKWGAETRALADAVIELSMRLDHLESESLAKTSLVQPD